MDPNGNWDPAGPSGDHTGPAGDLIVPQGDPTLPFGNSIDVKYSWGGVRIIKMEI